MVDSIIFDLDGTLWSSLDTSILAWNQALATRNISAEISKQQLRTVFGLQHDMLGAKLLPFLSDPERREIMEEIDETENALIRKLGGELFENTMPVLRTLSKKYPLFIVSNCQRGYIEAFLDFYKLWNLFKDFESFGNTRESKAHNISLIMTRNRLKKAVYVGDTLGDLQASEEAGIPFIYASYGFGNVVKSAYQISDIGDLISTNILEQFD